MPGLHVEHAQGLAGHDAPGEVEVVFGGDLDVEFLDVVPDGDADEGVEAREAETATEAEDSDVGALAAEGEDLGDEVHVVWDDRRMWVLRPPPWSGSAGVGNGGVWGEGGEVEVGEGGPEGPPSLGQDAGPGDGVDGEEEENVVEDGVWEVADVVGGGASLLVDDVVADPQEPSLLCRSCFHWKCCLCLPPVIFVVVFYWVVVACGNRRGNVMVFRV